MTDLASLLTYSLHKHASCILCIDNLDINKVLGFFNNLIIELLVHKDIATQHYKITIKNNYGQSLMSKSNNF